MGATSATGQWWDWWVATNPVAGATWVGTILSAVGLIVTIFGFVIAIQEARAARLQATAASVAVTRLKSSLGASALAYTHSQAGMLVQFVDGQHFNPAHVLLATIRREMLHHASDIRASANVIADLKRRLTTVSNQIGHAQTGDERFKPDRLRNSLNSIQQTIVEWENTIREQSAEVSK